MKKIFFFVLVGFFVLGVGNVNASYDGSAYSNYYSPTDNSCGLGHAVNSSDGRTIVSCITREHWMKSTALDYSIKKLMTIIRGQKVLLKNGVVDVCPVWYQEACVLDKDLFVRYIN
ncbi:hypothetical protein KKH36_01255 [Patescibacteria group bacterium]|nr:hypothetical protein [Patescibacteria group bacterium]